MPPHPSPSPRPIVPALLHAVRRAVLSMILFTAATAFASWLSIIQLPLAPQPFTPAWWSAILLASGVPAIVHAVVSANPKHDALLTCAAACPLIALALCLHILLTPGNSLVLFEALFLPILAFALPFALLHRWKHHENLYVSAPSPGFLPSNPPQTP